MIKTNKDLVWALSQIGFLAIFDFKLKDAALIFEGLNEIYDNNPALQSGLALIYVLCGMYSEAIPLYRHLLLDTTSSNYDLKFFLGVALWETGKEIEGKKLVNEAKNNGDENTIQFCETFIQVKKSVIS